MPFGSASDWYLTPCHRYYQRDGLILASINSRDGKTRSSQPEISRLLRMTHVNVYSYYLDRVVLKMSTSSARRKGTAYNEMTVNCLILAQVARKMDRGAASDWGLETLPRSMNESLFFLDVT